MFKVRNGVETLNLELVAVATALTGGPPHGSGRAELPHPALALGNNAKAHQRMRMITMLTPFTSGCLTVSAQDAYVHAQGLRPRGVQKRLAIPTPPVLPSAQFNNVGTPEWPSLARWWFNFAAQYLACTLPCQRFTLALTHEGT